MCGACLVLGRRDCLTKAAREAAAQAQVDRLPDRTTRMQPTEDSYTTVLVTCIALVCRDSRGAPVRPARRASVSKLQVSPVRSMPIMFTGKPRRGAITAPTSPPERGMGGVWPGTSDFHGGSNHRSGPPYPSPQPSGL